MIRCNCTRWMRMCLMYVIEVSVQHLLQLLVCNHCAPFTLNNHNFWTVALKLFIHYNASCMWLSSLVCLRLLLHLGAGIQELGVVSVFCSCLRRLFFFLKMRSISLSDSGWELSSFEATHCHYFAMLELNDIL